MDEVYIKMEDQTWEIPPTNRYISDSDSPLSLLSSPSPTMRSPTIPSSIISPLTAASGSHNAMMSMMLSTSAYSQDPLQISYPNNKQLYTNAEDDDDEEAEYRSVMFHEYIIASNDSISCVRPQSVSIKWSSLANNSTTDGILTTTTKEKEGGDHSAINSDLSSSTNEDAPAPTTSNSDNKPSTTIKISISREKEIKKETIVHQEASDLSDDQEEEVDSEDVETTIVEDQEDEETAVEDDQLTVVDEEECCGAVEEVEALLSSQPDEEEQEEERVLPMTIREAAALALPPSPPVTTVTTSKKRKYTKSTNNSNKNDHNNDKKKKKRKTDIVPTATVSNNRIVVISKKNSNNDDKKKKKKRTITSYDTQTSRYLKSVFFEVYSKQSKLTKAQRAQVQEKTGLPSRNITYWFSNHKRRFQDTLKVYRKIVDNSNCTIKNYDDFIQYRRDHGLPDQVTQEEILELDEE